MAASLAARAAGPVAATGDESAQRGHAPLMWASLVTYVVPDEVPVLDDDE